MNYLKNGISTYASKILEILHELGKRFGKIDSSAGIIQYNLGIVWCPIAKHPSHDNGMMRENVIGIIIQLYPQWTISL